MNERIEEVGWSRLLVGSAFLVLMVCCGGGLLFGLPIGDSEGPLSIALDNRLSRAVFVRFDAGLRVPEKAGEVPAGRIKELDAFERKVWAPSIRVRVFASEFERQPLCTIDLISPPEPGARLVIDPARTGCRLIAKHGKER